MKAKYLSGTTDTDFQSGRATVDESPLEQDPFGLQDPLWGIYGDARYLADWSQKTDERFDALNANIYDLAERFNQLIIILALWFILTVSALAALIIVDIR